MRYAEIVHLWTCPWIDCIVDYCSVKFLKAFDSPFLVQRRFASVVAVVERRKLYFEFTKSENW